MRKPKLNFQLLIQKEYTVHELVKVLEEGILMTADLTVIIKKTADMTPTELWEVFQERVKVFVVEQNCPYQEVDEKDQNAQHVMLKNNGQLVAYARIVPHDDPTYVSFGRVLVVKEFRGRHLAQRLIQTTLAEIKRAEGNRPVKIAAQSYLQDFYAQFGFKPVSEVYLEDNIPHLDMILE